MKEKVFSIRNLFRLNQSVHWSLLSILGILFLGMFVLVWQYMFPDIIPRIPNIFHELKILVMEKGMLAELSMSIGRVMKSMLFSVPIALCISLLGVSIAFFRPLAQAMPPLRFFALLGFAPIIRVLSGGGSDFQIYALMFGIIPWLATSFNTVFQDVDRDALFPYARTMGYSEIRTTFYVVFRNRLPSIYRAIRNNFAIAWMMMPTVEIANRDGGGIGALIFDHTRFINANDDVYAATFALNFVVLLCGICLDFLFRKLVLTLPEEKSRKSKK